MWQALITHEKVLVGKDEREMPCIIGEKEQTVDKSLDCLACFIGLVAVAPMPLGKKPRAPLFTPPASNLHIHLTRVTLGAH